MLKVALTFLIFFTGLVVYSDGYCYADEKNPYRGFSTFSAYDFVHGNLTERKPTKNCTTRQIWIFSRHGTRLPNPAIISDISFILPKIKSFVMGLNNNTGPQSMCKQDYENLKNWSLDPLMIPENGRKLVEKGRNDLINLGQRVKGKFPEIFETDDPRKFTVRSSNTSRTIESMHAFMLGLFDDEFFVQPQEILAIDHLLRPQSSCPQWYKQNTSKIAKQYRKNFLATPEFQNLVKNVTKRWELDGMISTENFREKFREFYKGNGLEIELDLITTVVTTIHEQCSLDTALYTREISPWCAAFAQEELRMLEYRNDLRFFHKVGYGYEGTKKLGCFPLKNMFQHFGKLEKNTSSNEPNGIFYFTHDTVLLAFYTAMGFFKDSKILRYNNYHEMENRLWKVSKITPYAGNLIAVFYNCADENSTQKVRIFINEKAVEIEGCEADLCDWQFLKNKFGKIVDECSEHC